MDQCRLTSIDNLPDPTNQGTLVKHWRGPNIKLDSPDINGPYQFLLMGTTINFLDRIAVRNIEIDYERSGGYQTIFWVIDKPKNKKNGQAFDIEVLQVDRKEQKLIGGQEVRIELVDTLKR